MTVKELLSHFLNHSLEIRILNCAITSEDDVFHSNIEALSQYDDEEVIGWYVEWDLFSEPCVQVLHITIEEYSDEHVFNVEDIRRVREELMKTEPLDEDDIRELNAEQHLQP